MLETAFPPISDPGDKPADAAWHPVPAPPSQATAVAKVDLLALALSRFGDWRAGAAALVERYRAVAFDLSTTKGYSELTKAIAEVRAPRFAAQNVSKASKSELAGVSKAIGAEEAAVAAVLADTEARLVALRDAHDAKVAADKAEAKRVEEARIAKHQSGIATIRSFLARCHGLPASRITLCIDNLAGQVYGNEWQEFVVQAANAQCETLESMRTLHAQTSEREAQALRLETERAAEVARLESQRAEQARVAAEQAAAQRLLDEQAVELSRQRKVAAAEFARMNRLQVRIGGIRAAATGRERATAADLDEAITAVAALDVSEGQFQEFASAASLAKDSTLAMLKHAHFEVTRLAAAEADHLAEIEADQRRAALDPGLSAALAADPAAEIAASKSLPCSEVPRGWNCATHGPGTVNAWVCPECVREMRVEMSEQRDAALSAQRAAEALEMSHCEVIERLRAALAEYANPLNWDEDGAGIHRAWLEPGSTTPAVYNGFETARDALRPSAKLTEDRAQADENSRDE